MKHKLSNMKCLDMYLSRLSDDEYHSIKHQISNPKPKAMPLLSWDIFMDGYHKRNAEALKNADLKKITELAETHGWKNNFSELLHHNDFEAIVITDLSQKIIWVNPGFSAMTGYTKQYALNKTPKFLQGTETSVVTKRKIDEKLALNQPFKETIINYRKDQSVYKCEVKIIPLYNQNTTHFLALEREVV